MIRVGLTGSIAMGKSTTAQMFRDAGIPVYDADAEVHRAYARGGTAVDGIAALVPEALIDGAIDRAVLRREIARNAELLPQIEAVVHPKVAAAREGFLDNARRDGADMAVLDIPLLFEVGADGLVDCIVVVTASPETQRARYMQRANASEAQLDSILARQLPDAEKRGRADFVVDTDRGLDAARAQVSQIIAVLRKRSEAKDA